MDKSQIVEIKKGQTGTGLLIENDGYMSMDESKRQSIIEAREESNFFVPNPFIVDAVFQKFGIKNANGRIYPENVLKKQVELYQQRIKEKRAYGECNHPSESTIDLGRISHNITELHWDGRTLVGKMELNITEGYRRHGIVSSYGDTIANLLLNGYKIGVSSRGLGSVEQKMGQYIVGDDFELICWDCVSDPSTNNAYISLDGEDGLKQYVESDESKKDANRLDEKIKKIESILKD